MTSTPQRLIPGRSRSTAEQQRTRILQSAVAVFAHAGYHATPVTEIAEKAGVSPAYVFRLFPGKLALFVAAVNQCYAQVADALVAGGEAAGPVGPDGILDAMTDAYVDLIGDRDLIMLQVHAQSACDIPEIREAVRAGVSLVVRAVARVSGAEPAAVQRFIAFGQLCHLIVQADLHELTDSWAETLTAGMRHNGPQATR